jgi:hypothetical protein
MSLIPQTTNRKPRTANRKPQTTNHKPQTTNHKPQTTNHKPQTTNPEFPTANQVNAQDILNGDVKQAPQILNALVHQAATGSTTKVPDTKPHISDPNP